MVVYRCRACNYKFQPKGDKAVAPRLCPYCSRENTLISDKNLLKEL